MNRFSVRAVLFTATLVVATIVLVGFLATAPSNDDSAGSDELASESPSTAIEESDAPTTTEPVDPAAEVIRQTPIPGACSAASVERWVPLLEPANGGWSTAVAISPHDADLMLVGGDVMGLAKSEDGGLNWRHVSGLLSGEIAQITWHPTDADVVWVGTLSGPAVSIDAGRTWQPSRVGMPEISAGEFTAPVEVVVFDPSNDRRLLAFGGNRRESVLTGDPGLPGNVGWGIVWESTDNGESWSRLALLDGIVTDAVFLADGSLIAALDADGLRRSDDGGTTWSTTGFEIDNPNVRDIEVTQNAVFVAVDAVDIDGSIEVGGIYRSNNQGSGFVRLETGVEDLVGDLTLASTGYRVVKADPTNPLVLYTSNVGWQDQSVLESLDGGDTWRRVLGRGVDAVGERFYSSTPVANDVSIAADGSGRVLLAGSEYLILGDGAGGWQDVSSVQVQGGGWMGTGYSGLVSNGVFFSEAHPGVIVLTAFDGGNLLLSTDDGHSWTAPLQEERPFDGGQYAAETTTGSIAVLLGQAGIFAGVAVSTDGGNSWQISAGDGLPEASSTLRLGGIVAVNDTFVAAIGDRLYRSVDEGATWSSVAAPEALTDMAVDADGTLFGSGAEGLWLSTNAGETFSTVGGPRELWRLATHPQDAGTVFATSWRTGETDRGLWRFDSSGWVRLTDTFHAYDLAIDPFSPDRMVLATDDPPFHDAIESAGVLCSTDGGATWTPISEGLSLNRVRAIGFDPHQPGRLIAGTNGGGFFTADLGADS